ncbi:hypothetical protein GO986_17735 [Deinococcus sp. HMF7620]|uniref:Uncharacterized protein n=1 Tax=Deinococcus arboris TaxID=2682977 RepID=A0A7C9LWT4_9DEIO|nr:hypothetical protein [Deinococcus arboris]MVN88580.1 hypothetical protein [Deinococcus arboris]
MSNITRPVTRKELALHPLQPWRSAEQFRKNLGDNLRLIERGQVGTLMTKDNKTIRLLSDEDFQVLYGLAREVDRLRDGIEVIIAAAVSVQENQNESAVRVLTKAALALGRSPVLPTRIPSKDFTLDDIKVDESDTDDSFDFNDIKRPF